MRDAADDRALRDQPIRTDATCGNPCGPQAFLAPGRNKNLAREQAASAMFVQVLKHITQLGGFGLACSERHPVNLPQGTHQRVAMLFADLARWRNWLKLCQPLCRV
jgi:hypothetical protein